MPTKHAIIFYWCSASKQWHLWTQNKSFNFQLCKLMYKVLLKKNWKNLKPTEMLPNRLNFAFLKFPLFIQISFEIGNNNAFDHTKHILFLPHIRSNGYISTPQIKMSCGDERGNQNRLNIVFLKSETSPQTTSSSAECTKRNNL